MTTTLLQTKLYIPPLRPHHVPRPELVHQLDEGLRRGCSLTLISAPAGYGKSTILVEWIQEHGLPVAWLSLDEGDNEPARFLAYLLAALQKVDKSLGGAANKRLQAPDMPALSLLMTALINDITAMKSAEVETNPRFMLVLDDFQAITSPAIHETIDFLLAQQPPQMHLVILTRQDPPLALSRQRGRGLVSELRQNDLRFSLEETTIYLVKSMGLSPLEAEISTLEDRTEGWIAGLQLAALSMRGLDPIERAQFITNFSGRYHFILDYLTDEVLKRQPEAGQQFLLQTAVLEQMCGPLCDAVLGYETPESPAATVSQSMLETLERGNLFLVPIDDERRWYRYHHLFAELLRARLHETWPAKVPELHHRAATWYEENGFMALAVDHAMLAGDLDAAAGVVERAIRSFATWSKVEMVTLMGWLEALPDEVCVNRPWLRLFTARAYYLTGQPEASRRAQQALEEWLTANPKTAGVAQVAGLVRADRASYAVVRGELSESIQFAQSALDHLVEEDVTGRMRAYAILGLAQTRAGNVAAAEQAFSTAIDLTMTMGIPLATVPLLCNLAEIQIMAGKLGQAEQSCRRALHWGAVDGPPLSVTGFGHLQLGKILYQQNDLAAAESHLSQALELLSQGGIAESFGNVHAELALTKQALGKAAEARKLARQGVQVAQEGDINRLITLAQAYQARVWLAQDSLDKAGSWAHGYRQLGPTQYLREIEDLTLVRVLLATEQPGKALSLTDAMLSPAERGGRLGRVIEIAALRGLAAQALGDHDSALSSLSRSLALAEPEGFRRLYLDEGVAMARLLYQVAQQGITPEYIGQLLAAFELETTVHAPGDLAAPSPQLGPISQPAILVEQLTEREMEVLQLLSEGLSNREIAGRLYLSPNTVRTHTYNLYGKLGVHSRLQAVTRARELNLLLSG